VTPEDFIRGLGSSPDFLWQDVDFINRRGLVVKFDEASYRRASFLDNRAYTRESLGVWLTLDRILERCADLKPDPAPHAIFHVSHCGSTLLSRLLAESPGCLPLREPLLPLALAVERRELPQAAARLDAAGWDRCFDVVLALISRVYRPGDRAVLKATSACGNLLAPFLERSPGSKAVLMHTDLETWLTVMLRKEDVRHNGRFYAQAWLKDLHALTGRTDLRLYAMSDAQQFAVNWLTAMLHFEQAARQHGERVQRCDFEALLADPVASITRTGGFLGLDTSRAADAVAGPLMKGYAKNPARAYDRAARDEELKQSRREMGAEIDAGMKFAEKLCAEIGMLAPLGAYLRRS